MWNKAGLIVLAALLIAPLPAPLARTVAAQGSETSGDGRASVPVGSQIVLRTTAEISSKTSRKGDLVALEVSEDWQIGGVTLIPAGTPAVGELTQADQKGMMGRGGKLAARMLYLELPSGPVRISGKLIEAGRDQTGLATVITGLTGGLTPFITGKSAVIPAGTELIVVLDREASIPPLKAPDPEG